MSNPSLEQVKNPEVDFTPLRTVLSACVEQENPDILGNPIVLKAIADLLSVASKLPISASKILIEHLGREVDSFFIKHADHWFEESPEDRQLNLKLASHQSSIVMSTILAMVLTGHPALVRDAARNIAESTGKKAADILSKTSHPIDEDPNTNFGGY